MRAVITIGLILIILLTLGLAFSTVFALEEVDYVDRDAVNEIIEQREEARSVIDDFEERYGNRAYGWTAFILETIQWISIPVCFLGIAVGAICHFAIGTRRLDMRHRGSRLMYAFGTLLVICQALPLIFALVVRGWVS
ncbi:MAG: hypothetical protein FWC79_03595 [Oscillospiraceae bacterium]|nr:hypothetical protein [Oscillospiraceae bacterium]